MLVDDLYNDELVDDPDDLDNIINGNDVRIAGNGNWVEEEQQEKRSESGEEGVPRKVEPKKKRTVLRGPKIDLERIKGPRGLTALNALFQDVPLRGKGCEKEDLGVILTKLEHWAHRLMPRLQFQDCLEKIENIGSKKPIHTYLTKIRLGLEDDGTADAISSDDDMAALLPPLDPFDVLISQSVDKSLPPKPLGSSPTGPPVNTNVLITEEQRERMLQNRLMAEERRLARMKTRRQEEQLSQKDLIDINDPNTNEQESSDIIVPHENLSQMQE